VNKSYKSLAKYYDLLFQDKDYLKEANFILDLAQKYKINTGYLLDVGCGTGTHLKLLKDNFKNLYGVDISQEILELAKEKIPEATFLNESMSEFNINRKFDLIICLYSVFNYNLDTDSALKSLKNFHTHLKPKGIVIIALYNSRNAKSNISIHKGKGKDIRTLKIDRHKYSPLTKTVRSSHWVFINDRSKLSFHSEFNDIYRVFDFKEIEKMTQKSRFKNLKIFDNFTYKEASEESKWPVLVLQK
jgi:SAM-dependent methyltransferase